MDQSKFGYLEDSSEFRFDAAKLRERLKKGGYLFLRSFLERDDILKIRRAILSRMLEEDLILPGPDDLSARANPAKSTAFMPSLAKDNTSIQELIYGERVLSLFESLLEGPVLHYDFTWFRPVGPGRGTPPHCDLVYMGRGTRQVYTMWVPYGDVSLQLGGLMVLENSHYKSEQLKTYLSRDVDSYCSNRAGSAQAQKTDTLLWDGKLTKNPVSLQEKLGGRWLGAEFEAGDLIIFGMTTVHGSLDNQTDQVRLSSDSRYQLASEAVDERWIGANPPGHSRAGKKGRIC